MKRYAVILLALMLAVTACGCSRSKKSDKSSDSKSSAKTEKKVDGASSGLKIGFLFPSDSGAIDTMSRMEGINKMQEATGLTDKQICIEENVKKKNCEKKIDTLVSDGCKLIFSTNKAVESIVVESSKKYPDVEFFQECGSEADEKELPNYHTYYTRLYEAYHVAGLVAGKKLVEMLNEGKVTPEKSRIGFVASTNSPEAISCYTAFYLGVQRAYEQAQMYVRFVDGTGVYDNDGKAARQLAMADVCIMGQYVSTTAVAAVCAENDIPLVGNDISMISTAPSQALTSATSDWSVYYTYAVNAALEEKKIEADWCKGYADGANIISQLNDKYVADNTVKEVAVLEKNIKDGKAKILNTEKMKIDGQTLDSLVKDNGKYKKYRKYIKNHTFQESMENSAPVFDLMIDGIEESTYDYVGEAEAEKKAYDEDEEN